MEVVSAGFFSALLAIVIIDLVLAGDNAIVIALAARNVPAHLRTKAIVWGTGGAIVVRSLLTMVAVWLLAIPGLLFAGGVLLVWIAYKLLLPDAQESEAKVDAGGGFWTAIRTIVTADLIMGLDNVLAVAGAAHGSYLLVGLGLLVSIPIVVWGSTLILRVIDRFPAFVYVGAGVLAWTAARMMAAEPLLAAFYAEHEAVAPILTAVIVGGVLIAGFIRNHRDIERRIAARIARPALPSGLAQPAQGETLMEKILLPVDGSPNSLHAVRHVISQCVKNPALELHVLNVQPAFSRHIARFVSRKNRVDYHHARSEAALLPVRRLLDKYRIAYDVHEEVGAKAKVIPAAARRLGCDRIVMSTARKNSLTRMLEDSTTNRVLEAASVPVEIIAGDAVSRLERIGIPAGIGAAIVLALLAAD